MWQPQKCWQRRAARFSSYQIIAGKGSAVLSETVTTLLASVSGILLFDSGNVLLALYPMALSGMRQNSDGPMNNRESHGPLGWAFSKLEARSFQCGTVRNTQNFA